MWSKACDVICLRKQTLEFLKEKNERKEEKMTDIKEKIINIVCNCGAVVLCLVLNCFLILGKALLGMWLYNTFLQAPLQGPVLSYWQWVVVCVLLYILLPSSSTERIEGGKA